MPFRYLGKSSWLNRYLTKAQEWLVVPTQIKVEAVWYASGTTSVSIPVTIASTPTNAMLVVLFNGGRSTTITAPTAFTWNGQTLTQQVSKISPTNLYANASIFTLANPTAGTGNLVNSGGTFDANKTIVVLLSGVNQTTPILSTGTAGGNAGTYTITLSSEQYGFAMDCGCGGQTCTIATPDAAQTPLYDASNPWTTYLEASGASTDMKRTTSINYNAIAAICFKPA